MRLFSKQENKWIKSFVDTKNKGIKHIAELQVARILRSEVPFMCLHWNNDTKVITIISPKGTSEEVQNKLYFNIVDFIEFIKELERYGFITLQNLTTNGEPKSSLFLFDRNKYTQADDLIKDFPGINFTNLEDAFFQKLDNGVQALVITENPEKIHLDFIDDLNKYGHAIIYPLPLAESYVDNHFKTLETYRYNKQMIVAWLSFFAALAAAIISLCFGIYQKDNEQKIDNTQIEHIESIIKSNHQEDPINVTLSDTIVVKPLTSK